MKSRSLILNLLTACLLTSGSSTLRSQDIDSLPPVVLKTVPAAGAKDVAPGTMEIKVTFSKPMTGNSWSWSTAWQDSAPAIIGKPRYEADQKTCVIKVTLEPNKTYGYWINSENFKGFRDKKNKPAVPYLLAFKTRSE